MSSEASYGTNTMSSAPDTSLTIIKTIVLLTLLIISLVGNSLLVFAIAVSSKRRQNPFNAYLLSMAIFGLLECCFTMSLATGYSLQGTWMFGTFFKGFNACFIEMQNIGVLLTITAMSVDRYLSMIWKQKYYKESSVHRANYIVLYTWIHSFLVSLPLLFHNEDLGLTVREYVERSLCALSEGTTIIYTVILTVTSYAMPFLVAIIYFIIVFLKSDKERKEMKKQNTANYASYCLQESQLLVQARCAKLVFALFLLYLIFKVPYICIDLLTQFGVDQAYVSLNSTYAASNKFHYQTAISWLMFCFSAMYPIVAFTWFADHRKRVRMHLCCGKERVAVRRSQARHKGHQRQVRRFQERNERLRNKTRKYRGAASTANNRSKIKNAQNVSSVSTTKEKVGSSKVSSENGHAAGFRVPVLYAAADGLHLLASNKTNRDSLLKATSIANTEQSSSKIPENTHHNSPGTKSDAELSSSTKSAPSQKAPKNWLTLNPGELLKRFKKNNPSNGHIGNDDSSQIESTTDRPSSVVDTRVDIRGSTDCLQSEEERYFKYASSDFEDDTESELNESANSRTLILPNRRVATAPVKKTRRARAAAISPLPPIKGAKAGFIENHGTEQVEVHRSASLEELPIRPDSPHQSGTSSPVIRKNLETTYRMFSSNLALRQNSEDATSMISYGSLHSVRFDSDLISLANSVCSLSPHQGNDEKIFVRTREVESSVNENLDTNSRLHTPVQDVPSPTSIKSLKKLFGRSDTNHSLASYPSPSRSSSANAPQVNRKFPPLSDNIKNYLTSQKYR